MSNFFILDSAKNAVAPAIEHVRASSSGELRTQVERALVSIVLNLAEGSGRFGRDRLQHYRIAYGSLQEAKAGISLIIAISNSECLSRDLTALDSVGAMMWKLVK